VSRSPQKSQAGQKSERYVAGWQATLSLLREGMSWSGSERNCVFLNAPGLRFTDISAASGLDYADDGRGLAVVDWDADGDLDLWLANRTGPRLRLMLNEGATDNQYVALKLRGTTANRDAIGARVEIESLDPAGQGHHPNNALVRTVYAGDGFLSQSSKWLHFGLGTEPDIERVTVRWPGGESESFSGVRPGRRYELVQGRGAASVVATRQAVKLDTSLQQQPPQSTAAERVSLPIRLPLPLLRYTPSAGGGDQETVGLRQPGNQGRPRRPLLLNFWASWCLPCISELKELTARAPAIDAVGLDVLALSVDGLDRDQVTGRPDAERTLSKIGFPFASGFATTELLEKIELLQDVLLDRSLPFAVPISLLLDRDAKLAATYRGRMEVDEMLRDAQNLDVSRQQRRMASSPLSGSAGRWVTPPPGTNPLWLAQSFNERYPEDAERFLRLALEDRSTPPEEAALRHRLAEAVYRQGRGDEAIAELRRAIALDGGLARAHKSLAGLLQSSGEPQEAMRHYQRAVELDPLDAEAHQGLGVISRATGHKIEALLHLREAARLRPDWPAPLIPLAWTLITQASGDATSITEAIGHAERAVELSEDRHPVALDTLAAVYAAAGRSADAIVTAGEAIERAKALDQESLAAQIQTRLDGYRRAQGSGNAG